MATRPSWEGFLKFSLISVPVKAYTAAAGGKASVGFNLLHKGCNSRIRYKKVCPIHGEVEQSEIVSGYEYAKGKYVVVDPEEVGKLRAESDKSINIDAFVPAKEIDPLYFAGRTYYLLPTGKVAQKPYTVLQEVMGARQRYGIAQVVLSGREHLAVVRSSGDLLMLSMLSYAEQLKSPKDFEDEIVHPKISAEERKLADTLIEASTREEFDLAKYRDDYAVNLQKLVDAKVKGKRIVAERAEDEPAVINLMDALRKSLNRADANGKPSRKTKAPKGGSRSAPRRRKTG